MRLETVYVGDDWAMYVSRDRANYNHSEMVAPCLILGAPQESYDVIVNAETTFSGTAFLHPCPLASGGDGRGIVLLYVDPLSDEGRAIQRRCQGNVVPWQQPPHYGTAAYTALVELQWSPQDVRAFVDQWRTTVRAALPAEAPIDPRLLRVAAHIAENVEGRLDLTELSAMVNLSADHLRDSFKKTALVTLSRYQMWKRMHAMLSFACQINNATEDVSAPLNDVMHSAGFYDLAHGSKAVEQYFGMASPMALGMNMRFRDCRQ